ncbi:hypothetical protein [Sinomonas atrocyanea]
MRGIRKPPRVGAAASRQPGRVRTHWIVLAALLVGLALALAVQGYTQHLAGIGDDSVPAATGSDGVPASVLHGARSSTRGHPPSAPPGLPSTRWPSPSTTVPTRSGPPASWTS